MNSFNERAGSLPPTNANAITKARLGFAVAIGVGAGLLNAAIFFHYEALRRNVDVFCLVAAAVGFLAWLAGGLFERKRAQVNPLPLPGAEAIGPDRPLTVSGAFEYWGFILIVSTGPLFALNAAPGRKPLAVAPPLLVKAKAKPAVVFPSLELRGLTRNGTRSSAIINGQVIFIGEGIGDVVLLAVEDEQVTVGLGDQTKVLVLRK